MAKNAKLNWIDYELGLLALLGGILDQVDYHVRREHSGLSAWDDNHGLGAVNYD